jgi:hypothetical protein
LCLIGRLMAAQRNDVLRNRSQLVFACHAAFN